MRKKFIAVYALMAVLALGSTTLTSCVDDNESASVTAIRNAKAEQLNALAAAANADAEVQKAEALYKQALAAQTEQQTAEDKARFEAEIESLKALYEQQRQNYEQQIIQNQALFRNTLYQNYLGANSKLKELEGKYIEAQLNLASAKAGVTTAEKAAQATILAQDEEIAKQQAMIEAYKALPENSRDELLKQIEELTVQTAAKQAEVNLKKAASDEAENAYEESKYSYSGHWTDNNNVYVEPTLKTAQAIASLLGDGYYNLLKQVDFYPNGAVYVGKYSLNGNLAATQQRMLESNLADLKEQLGKNTDKWDEDATGTQSAYAWLDYYKSLLDEAAEKLEDEEITEDDYNNISYTYYNYKENTIPQLEAQIETKTEELAEFKANIALLDPACEDYKAYIAALENTVELYEAYEDAYDAYRLEAVAKQELEGTKSVAEGLLTGNPDINVKIAECEKAIAEAEAKKVTAGTVEVNYTWHIEYKMADQNFIDNCSTNAQGVKVDAAGNPVKVGDYLNSQNLVVSNKEDAAQYIVWHSETVNAEAYYKECELEVENLKSEIEAQKLIVAQCKAELEAAINSGATDNTPAEETPAE
ncbi:hypothetical protein [Phocaeicola coprophilus]